ncbi:hypothetical protein PBY51_021926 [Eleginops maclovinus]|uniref:HERV-H LTR-associating protein 1 n=1 Tax=Eleginops maclovinus TaxID=56733 RepID=A0AAN7XGT9_ELEMC|nr:hypothetical protein PBY51_021926 [Eleginops maclovinus]
MAALQRLHRASQHPRLCFLLCVSTVSLLFLFSQAFRDRQQEERRRRDVLNSTEIPAEHIDPAAIDLTPLVNTLINTSQSGSRQLFSLLSVTSYSSLALHKLTLLVYNISSIKTLESNKFRRRFCYCVTNETNDLTDFTAILLDVMGNSTSYLHELFKSASILSVSQRNNSECIYICVMAGKMGREVPDLWEVGSVTPLFNQTIVEGPHRIGNFSTFKLPVEWHQLPTNLSHISPSGMSSMLTSRVLSTAHVSPTTPDEKGATTAQISTAQLLATHRHPATSVPQGLTTPDRPETTTTGTTQRWTTQKATTQAVTTARRTTAAEETTALQPTTSLQVTTAAAPTTVISQSTRVSAPSTTVSAPSTTVSAPSTTVSAPSTTVSAPSTTVSAPSTTVSALTQYLLHQPEYLLHQPQYLLHQQCGTINHSKSSINHSKSSINHSKSSINHSKSSINHGIGSINHGKGSINHSKSSINHGIGSINHGKGSNNHSKSSINFHSNANNHRRHTINHSRSANNSCKSSIDHSKSSIYQGDSFINHSNNPINHKFNPTGHSITQTHNPFPTAPTVPGKTSVPLSKKTTTPSKSVETEKAGCPWRRPDLTEVSSSGSTTTVSAHKLQPCVLELCQFFSQCLCRPFNKTRDKTRMKRYCDDSHLWYEQHTSEVCRRVRRVSFSRNLKQRCLTKMCNKL